MSRSKVYNRYMASSRWQEKRRQVLERANYRCQKCGIMGKRGLHVHHLNYLRFGDEDLDDLQAVCARCHTEIHPHMRRRHRAAIWAGRLYRVEKVDSGYAVLEGERQLVVIKDKASAIRYAEGADSVDRKYVPPQPSPSRVHYIQRKRAKSLGYRSYRVNPEILREFGTQAAIKAAYPASS